MISREVNSLILAASKHQLHRADPDGQHAKPEPVEAQPARSAAAWQENHQAAAASRPNGRLM